MGKDAILMLVAIRDVPLGQVSEVSAELSIARMTSTARDLTKSLRRMDGKSQASTEAEREVYGAMGMFSPFSPPSVTSSVGCPADSKVVVLEGTKL